MKIMKINNIIRKTMLTIKAFLKDPLFLGRWDDPDYHGHRKNDNQLSLGIFGSRNRDLYLHSGDAIMFVQDMYLGIMPFMHYRGQRELYPAKLNPPSAEKESLIAEGISDRYSSHFLEDALCDFVRTTTQVMYQDGVAFYEIIAEKNKEGETECFEFEPIRSAHFFRFLNNYYQFISWQEAKKYHVRVKIIKIPREKILRIDFPKQLGGRKKLIKIIKRLWKLSKEIVPKFQMNAMENDKSIGFDMEKFSKLKFLEVAKMTRDFGWGQGQRSENYLTEYYLIVRHLRTKKAEAIIRHKIISELNNVLNGSLLRLGVRISMDNVFTPQDVEKQEGILRKGNINFIDIINAIKI